MDKKIITDEAIEGTASVMTKRLAKSFFAPPRLGKMADVINRLVKERERLDKSREEMLKVINRIDKELKHIHEKIMEELNERRNTEN